MIISQTVEKRYCDSKGNPVRETESKDTGNGQTGYHWLVPYPETKSHTY